MHRYQKNMWNYESFRNKSNGVNKFSLNINDIPRVRSLPLIGTKLNLIAAGGGSRLHKYIDSRHKQLGPIFAEKLAGSQDLVFISDPLHIKSLFINMEGKYPEHILPDPWVVYENTYGSKRGLFFMNGEKWLHNRRILNKHLLKDGAEDWISHSIRETINSFIKDLKERTGNDVIFKNLEGEFYKLSTNVLINVLLGESSIERSRHYDEILNIFSDSVKTIFQATTNLYGLPAAWCQYFNLKVWRDFRECVDLSLSLARKMTFELIKNKDKHNGLIKRLVQENLDDEIIARITADFIIAAGDTTAYTTLWILLLLSRNKEIMKEIRVKDETYVKFVIKEAMRLYPIAPFLTRVLPRDTVLADYMLSQGTPIIASIYTSGRDEQNFTMSNSFLPHRWDKGDPRQKQIVNHVPSASLPFAMGSRSCIGKKIAIGQLMEVISQVVNNFDIKCVNCRDVKSMTSQVLIPDQQLEFIINVRRDDEHI